MLSYSIRKSENLKKIQVNLTTFSKVENHNSSEVLMYFIPNLRIKLDLFSQYRYIGLN